MRYDVFLCHASEDKASFVGPLADALVEEGLDVWYDDFTLEMGDSLRGAIDRGLAQSTFGVVVLSPAFFAKQWPQKELDALFAKETASDEKVILPVWHELGQKDVEALSPLIAGTVASKSANGIPRVVADIVKVIDASGRNDPAGGYRRVYQGRKLSWSDIQKNAAGGISLQRFIDCEISGPAVLLIGDNIQWIGIQFGLEQVWPIDRTRGYFGVIPVDDCRFERCAFLQTGLAMHSAAALEMLRQVGADARDRRRIMGPFLVGGP